MDQRGGVGMVQALALLMVVGSVLGQSSLDTYTDFTFSYLSLYPNDFWCPELKISSQTLDVNALRAADTSGSNSILFLEAGTYKIDRSLTLNKPIYTQEGTLFDIAEGVTLTLVGAVSHPISQLFTGPGKVSMPWGFNSIVPVEWMGAKGDGKTDDAAAIRKALDTAAGGPDGVLFSAKTYAIGSTITRPTGVRIYSEKGAVLRALRPDFTGMIIAPGITKGLSQLPSFTGFKVAVQAAGLSHMTVPSIEDCGDAIWLRHSGDDIQVGVFIEVGTIRNCGRAVALSLDKTKKSALMQGNEITVGSFLDTTGRAKALLHFQGPNMPAWDSGTYTFGTVDATAASGFAVLRYDFTNIKLLRQNIYITEVLKPLGPNSKLVDGWIGDITFRIKLAEPFRPGQLDMTEIGRNNFIFEDPPAIASRVYSLSASRRMRKSDDPIHSTQFTVEVPRQGSVWKKGTSKRFYFYHQLAQKSLLYFMVQPTHGGMCMPNGLAVTGLYDNSGAKGGNPYEVMVALIACKDIPANTPVTFPLLVGSVGT